MIGYSAHSVQRNNAPTPSIIGTGSPQTRTSPPAAADPKAALYSDPTRRPAVLATNYDGIPRALRERRQWIMWDTFLRRDRSGGERWNKEPLRVWHFDKGDKKNAKSNDASTWVSFEYLRSVATAARGRSKLFPTPPHAGFVFAPDGGLVGIDIDKCRDPQTGELSGVAQKIVAELPGYWEASPSGTGIKGFHLGSLPADWKGKGRKVKVGDGPEEVEAYDRLRFFAVTGHRIEQATADVTANPEALAGFFATYFPARNIHGAAVSDAATRPTGSTIRTRSAARKKTSRDERLGRARAWLRATPGAVSGNGGQNHTFYVANHLLRGFDLAFNDAWDLLVNDWNNRCSPPWDTVATDGADSLYRKLQHADAEPGERGWKLADQVEPEPEDAPPAKPLDLSGLDGPPDPEYSHADCSRRYCWCKPDRPFYTADRAGSPEDAATVRARPTCSSMPPNAPEEQVGHKPDTGRILREIVGTRPSLRPCPRRMKRWWHGNTPTTIELDALIYVACDCWACLVCRTRLRFNQKDVNVPIALARGTHHWRGSADACNALAKRLDRARVQYTLYWVTLGAGERGAILAVEPESLALVPADIPDLTAATGEKCARKLGHFIDLIPNDLPAGVHRFGTRGPLPWLPDEEDEKDIDVEAGGSCEGEGGCGVDEAMPAAAEDDHPFVSDTQTPVVGPDADFMEFLLEIEAEQCARGVPERERVNPQRGTLCDWGDGGSIEDSILWRRPVDPDLNRRIENRILLGPSPLDDPLPD